MKKVFGMGSLFITFAIALTYIFIAPEINIRADNFFTFAPIGLLIALIFALMSKGIWRKAAIGSLVSLIVLFGLFIFIIRIMGSGP